MKYYKDLFVFPLHAVLLSGVFLERFLVRGEFFDLSAGVDYLGLQVLRFLFYLAELVFVPELGNNVVGVNKGDIQ